MHDFWSAWGAIPQGDLTEGRRAHLLLMPSDCMLLP